MGQYKVNGVALMHKKALTNDGVVVMLHTFFLYETKNLSQ